MTGIEELRREIEALDIQKRAKEREIRQLQDAPTPSLVFAEGFAGQSANLRSGDKIALMLELFGARRDVYAKYWENATTGKKGYSPAYANDRGMGAVGRLRTGR